MFLRNNAGRGKSVATEDGLWSDEKRIEAVATYIALGSMVETHKVTGIPQNTLWNWKKYSPWWVDVERTLREEHNAGTSSKISGIVERTLEAIKERMESGDYVYNQRSGEIARVPISAASLGKIATTLLDRKLALDKIEKVREEDSEDNTERLTKQLDKLAVAFSKFVDSKKKEEKVINAVQIEEPISLPVRQEA